MDSFNSKKALYVELIAGHIMKYGIKDSSLKKMAESASTSDRMLMHYFKDKEEILTLALNYINQELIDLLERNSNMSLNFEEFVVFLNQATKNDQFKPYLNLWFELIHLASDEKEPYFSVSKSIGESYWEWLVKMYIPQDNEDKHAWVSLLYAITEGFVFLDRIGMTEKTDAAVGVLGQMYTQQKQFLKPQ